MAVLEVKNLGIAFGGLRALQDVQFTIGEKEIIGLIGPNGAGKTTVFNLLTDVYVPTEGTITLENQNIVGKKTYQITQGGISRTFQNIRLFKDISVIDNVKIAMNFQMKYSVLSGIFRTPGYRREEQQIDQRAHIPLGRKSRGFGKKSALWTAAKIGDCPCVGNQPEDFATRRTRCGDESNRDQGAHGDHPPDSRPL